MHVSCTSVYLHDGTFNYSADFQDLISVNIFDKANNQFKSCFSPDQSTSGRNKLPQVSSFTNDLCAKKNGRNQIFNFCRRMLIPFLWEPELNKYASPQNPSGMAHSIHWM